MQNLVHTTTSIIPIIFSLLIIQSTALESCAPFSCNRHRRDTIQFPFWVPRNQSNRCGYPGFNLSCDGDETLLHLKNSNPFTVRAIDYPDQLIWVTDPNRCLPKRVLELNLTKTPFVSGPSNTEYSFLNCSSAVNNNDSVFVPDGTSVVSCLSERNFTVFLTFVKGSEQKMVNEWKCKVIKRVVAPIWWPDFGYGFIPPDLSNVFLQLSWDIPDCGDCELRGGSCGFLSDSGLSVGCFLPNGNGSESPSLQLLIHSLFSTPSISN